LLKVERRDDLPVDDCFPQVRGVLCQGVDDRVAELFAPLAPRPFLQIVRRELDVD
jgi:hypothetical protein